jgi:hypothetical protein
MSAPAASSSSLLKYGLIAGAAGVGLLAGMDVARLDHSPRMRNDGLVVIRFFCRIANFLYRLWSKKRFEMSDLNVTKSYEYVAMR